MMLRQKLTLRSNMNRLGRFGFRTRDHVKSGRIVASAIKAIVESLEPRVLLSGATLVDDINKVSLPSNPLSFVVAGNEMFFFADDGTHGDQLWKSDGTSNGTVMVPNTTPGATPEPFAALGNDVFLYPSNGQGLYISDGTTAGTKMLSSIQPYILTWTVYNNRLYFEGYDTTHGIELWTSDGTAAGTYLLSDIASGSYDSLPQDFVPLNGEVYFAANTPAYGNELWKTDGTTAGTTMVADINPGSGSSNPTALATMNGKLYFIASSTASTSNLYVSDGTAGGTHEVSTVSASALASNSTLSVIGNSLYFLGTNASYGQELWKSDGTAAGTVVMQDITPGTASSTNVSAVYSLNGYQYFWANEALWRTSGVPFQTTFVTAQSDNPIGPALAVGNYLYYASTTQGVLWRTDGTAAGTVMVSQYIPRSISHMPDELVNLNGTLLFNGGVDSATNVELAGILPGTSQPTLIKDINPIAPNGSNPKNFVRVGNQAFFLANDGTTASSQLWATDGTGSGTYLLGTISGQTLSAAPLGSSLLYLNGYQLWKTDGTPTGTVMVQDLTASNPLINFAGAMTSTGNLSYFLLNDGGASTGNELWESDGTSAGTHIVYDIKPGTGGSFPNHLTPVGNELYFDANDGTHGDELWKTDGTAQGTVLVDDVIAGSGSSFPNQLTNVAGTLYLLMYDSSGTLNLWKSDGTPAGTVEITNAPGMPIAPFGNLTAVEDELYFTADTAANGVELWKTNGMPSGTQLVDDINPGSGSSSPKFFEAMGNTLYFNAFDSSGQGELFKTDGTAAGTIQLTQGLTYVAGSISDKNGIRSLTAVGDTLFFAANDGVHGDELWSSDGTAAGTVMVQDIGPGDSLDDSATTTAVPQLLSMGTYVLFAANDHQIGTELWRADAAPLPAPGSISGTVFYDSNGNGQWDSNEAGSPSSGVFLDTNNDGIDEPSEPELTSDSSGQYTFSDLSPGTYYIRPIPAADWTQTAPPGDVQMVAVSAGQAVTNINFGQVRGAATASAASSNPLFTGDNYALNFGYAGFNPVTSWTIKWGDGSVQTITAAQPPPRIAIPPALAPLPSRSWPGPTPSMEVLRLCP